MLAAGDHLTAHQQPQPGQREVRLLIEADEWLRTAACRHFPESAFARKYGHGLRLLWRGRIRGELITRQVRCVCVEIPTD
jgi:hypothetical protein